jgi:hypothetical protein
VGWTGTPIGIEPCVPPANPVTREQSSYCLRIALPSVAPTAHIRAGRCWTAWAR